MKRNTPKVFLDKLEMEILKRTDFGAAGISDRESKGVLDHGTMQNI